MEQYKKIFAAWIALGVAGATTVTTLVGACALFPIIGWFIGIPLVLVGATMAAMLWLGVLPIIFLCLPIALAGDVKK